MDDHGRLTRALLQVAAVVLVVIATVPVPGLPARADPTPLDPAALPRGGDPAVAYVVRDTIKDGERRVPATRRGQHQALWVVRGGYLVRDHDVGPRRSTRLTYIGRTGERRTLARSREWMQVAVSADGSTHGVSDSSPGETSPGSAADAAGSSATRRA